jgi:hypothetical protein
MNDTHVFSTYVTHYSKHIFKFYVIKDWIESYLVVINILRAKYAKSLAHGRKITGFSTMATSRNSELIIIFQLADNSA